jgi:hypothetical protein
MEVKKQLVETSWSHAGNFIWLFDATGQGWDSKPGIDKHLQLTLTKMEPEHRYQLLNKGNRIAILLPEHPQFNRQKSKDQMRADNPGMEINEENLAVTRNDLQRPDSVINRIEGILQDSSRHYNSRWFGVNLQPLNIDDAKINSIALFKNINAIRVTAAGSLRGNLELESGANLPWAILTLKIEIPAADENDPPNILEFRAQANRFGDFLIPLDEFPALDSDPLVETFSATLNIEKCAINNDQPDPDSLTSVNIKDISGGADFHPTTSFQIKPGEHPVLKRVGSQSIIVSV